MINRIYEFNYDAGIIKSLLDTDYYKFTMGQFAWKYYPKVKVKYAFKNRTKNVKLGNFIDKDVLLRELDKVRLLKFSLEELNYLKSLGIFSNDYLSFLNNLTLPPVYADIKDGKLVIETEGLWPEAIFWETFILSIVNELYYNKIIGESCSYTKRKAIMTGGKARLSDKLWNIHEKPFKFADFGTRRRFSAKWQSYVVSVLSKNIKEGSFLGTANVYLAKQYNLKPIGTLAHELPMVLAGINDYNLDVLKHSHDKMLTLWEYLYGKDLSIALTDTFGTDFFFRDFSKEKAKFWKGLRQDSGDPFEFGQKVIKFYKDKNINPKEKLIVFSDGLNIETILKLEKVFKNKFITAYGWGTNLTNDLGYAPLSIVVKAVGANGRPLVKLSDNLAKAIGDKKTMDKYKKVFVYDNTYTEPTLY